MGAWAPRWRPRAQRQCRLDRQSIETGSQRSTKEDVSGVISFALNPALGFSQRMHGMQRIYQRAKRSGVLMRASTRTIPALRKRSQPPGSCSEPGGILSLSSAKPFFPHAAIAAFVVRYLESAAAYWEVARIYLARSKALGWGRFFWLRLPLS